MRDLLQSSDLCIDTYKGILGLWPFYGTPNLLQRAMRRGYPIAWCLFSAWIRPIRRLAPIVLWFVP
jgi:hypothetical protein